MYVYMDNKADEKVRKKLGAQLKAAREEAGLTQAQLAAKAKVNANYYAVVERGEGNLSVEKLQRIMKVLNIKSLEML
jgi:transcriptional regulator with XRE-family HTH domain